MGIRIGYEPDIRAQSVVNEFARNIAFGAPQDRLVSTLEVFSQIRVGRFGKGIDWQDFVKHRPHVGKPEAAEIVANCGIFNPHDGDFFIIGISERAAADQESRLFVFPDVILAHAVPKLVSILEINMALFDHLDSDKDVFGLKLDYR